jgi:hypothetical protein
VRYELRLYIPKDDIIHSHDIHCQFVTTDRLRWGSLHLPAICHVLLGQQRRLICQYTFHYPEELNPPGHIIINFKLRVGFHPVAVALKRHRNKT